MCKFCNDTVRISVCRENTGIFKCLSYTRGIVSRRRRGRINYNCYAYIMRSSDTVVSTRNEEMLFSRAAYIHAVFTHRGGLLINYFSVHTPPPISFNRNYKLQYYTSLILLLLLSETRKRMGKRSRAKWWGAAASFSRNQSANEPALF